MVVNRDHRRDSKERRENRFPYGDMQRIQEVMLSRNGAKWIEKGQKALVAVIRQGDGVHRKRACRRALGTGWGSRLQVAIRAGRWAEAQEIGGYGPVAQAWPCPERQKSRGVGSQFDL